MVVHDFNIGWTFVRPDEANSPALIDTDAVLLFSVRLKCFEMVCRRCPEVVEGGRGIQHIELA